MGSRRKGRILAFQAIFSSEISSASPEELQSFNWLDEDTLKKINQDTILFARLLVSGTIERLEEIDEIIKKHLDHWKFERISKVDLAVLRMSVYSLLYQKDIPSSVTIDEAIDIVKDFGGNDSYRFVNGVLDGIRKSALV